MSTPYRIVQSAQELTAALMELGPRVAVDTEFHAEHHYYPQLKLIQIRDEAGPALLIDPLAIRDLSELGAALSARELVLHAMSQDLPLLAQRCGLRPGRVYDTQVYAGFLGLGYPTALNATSRTILGVSMDRGSTLSNWQQRPLSEEQRAYAASDVQWLHALLQALQERMDETTRGRALAATEELLRITMSPPGTDLLWRDMPGATVLDGRERAALRALTRWREQTAQRLDQPRWQVAPDSALVDLARRRPADGDAIAQNRKLPRRLSREFADEVLGALDDASEEPSTSWPPSVAARGDTAMLDHLLSAWAHGVEAATGVSAALVLPEWLRRALVLREIDDRWPKPDLGWRTGPFGAEIHALIQGDLAIGRRPRKP